MLEVLSAPALATVQDLGRPGFRHLGVPLSGALDPVALRLANGLLDNPSEAAALEWRLVGPALRALAPVRLAFAHATARLRRLDGREEICPAWQTVQLGHGDEIRLGAPQAGVAYMAVAGGVDVPLVLGSRATYLRAHLGGLHGRILHTGDTLPIALACQRPQPPMALDPGELFADHGPIRVLPGPQAHHFDDAALERFFSETYTVGAEADRMGLRLAGPPLTHNARGADIVSDGVTPGAVQVPADGTPIVLLADCQTVGGYSKIATVIRADLPRLGRLLPGATLRFERTNPTGAASALREQETRIAATLAAKAPPHEAGVIDLAALYAANLVDGVVYAR